MKEGNGEMTAERLERYFDLKKEVLQLQERLEGFSARKNEAPVDAWNERILENLRVMAGIEDFIESVPDERLRLAMRYRFYDGLTWQVVAMRCGWQDWRTPRWKIDRFIRDCRRTEK